MTYIVELAHKHTGQLKYVEVQTNNFNYVIQVVKLLYGETHEITDIEHLTE